MITKEYGFFSLFCDSCIDAAVDDFERFSDALDYAERNGWGRIKEDGEWINLCPECIKSGGKANE